MFVLSRLLSENEHMVQSGNCPDAMSVPARTFNGNAKCLAKKFAKNVSITESGTITIVGTVSLGRGIWLVKRKNACQKIALILWNI